MPAYKYGYVTSEQLFSEATLKNQSIDIQEGNGETYEDQRLEDEMQEQKRIKRGRNPYSINKIYKTLPVSYNSKKNFVLLFHPQ